MLENLEPTQARKYVFRLTSLITTSIRSVLLNRGIAPENLEDIVSLLSDTGFAFSVNEVVDDVFTPSRNRLTPFPKGRFGDGTIGVYYSALEETTCKLELAYHLFGKIQKEESESLTSPRFYVLIECFFEGRTIDLCGQENQWPELVSKSESGYPFCQNLGLQAVELSIDGFLTTSARSVAGTCLPVFSRKAISDPKIKRKIKLVRSADDLDYRNVNFLDQ